MAERTTKSEWFETLRSSLEQMETAGRSVKVFVRDDDVDEAEASLHQLLNRFLELEIPINLEIIPGLLTGSAIATLKRHRQLRPDLFELNQHGWLHVNHETEGRKCEFGAKRNYEQQQTDIRRGQEVLRNAFGEAFSPVFTPPWNRCTEETHRALDQLGFAAISKLQSKQPVVGYGLRELSVTLDIFRWQGGATLKPADEIIAELVSQLRELDMVGIMLHHKVMDDTAFEFIRQLLDELRRSEAVSFHTFRGLLKMA
ncbi:MAG: polysaccharide deacetylase family protein [Blastocatellales bacterium]